MPTKKPHKVPRIVNIKVPTKKPRKVSKATRVKISKSLKIYQKHIRGISRKHKISYIDAKIVVRYKPLVKKMKASWVRGKKLRQQDMIEAVKKLHPYSYESQKIALKYFSSEVRYPTAHKEILNISYKDKKRYKFKKQYKKVYDYKYHKWISKREFAKRVKMRKRYNHIQNYKKWFGLSYKEASILYKYMGFLFGVIY